MAGYLSKIPGFKVLVTGKGAAFAQLSYVANVVDRTQLEGLAMKSKWIVTVLGVALAGMLAVGCGGEKKDDKKAEAPKQEA
ncbi:MAG: hypothetical protein Q7I92_12985, partial [Humidesulfovibrio sp.]|nr:hypothetical protein [Humidesulfovibrio sp.]